MSTGSIEIVWPGIRKQIKNDGDLFLVVGASASISRDEVLAASEQATNEADATEEGRFGGDRAAESRALVASSVGPIVVLVGGDGADTAASWVESFAAGLARRGIEGKVAAAAQETYPKALRHQFSESSGVTALGSFMGATMDSPWQQGVIRWAVAPDPTRRLTELTADLTYTGAAVFLTRGPSSLRVELSDFADVLALPPDSPDRSGITYLDSAGRGFNSADYTFNGNVTFTYALGSDAWEARVALARRHLIAVASDLDFGVVRPRVGAAVGFNQIDGGAGPALPFVHPGTFFLRRNEWNHLVPDAHGLQVLTSAHLDRASDLSNWVVTDLGADRHLVEAADRSAWFSTTAPSEPVVDRARADFGSMIMTEATR